MTLPFVLSAASTFFAVLLGMAMPIPANAPLGLVIAALIPMTSPRMFASGPPLLPGLMAASV